MRLTVILEFLLSGFLLILGLAALIDSLSENNIVFEFLRGILIGEQQIPESIAVGVGVLFLGFCYVVGTFTNVFIFDHIQRSFMRCRMGKFLNQNPALKTKTSALPSNIKNPKGKENAFLAIDAFLDVHALESSQTTRMLETSLQRLARGSFLGLLLILFASVNYVASNFAQEKPPLNTISCVIIVSLMLALVCMSVSQFYTSVRDEIDYVSRVFLLIADRGKHGEEAGGSASTNVGMEPG